MSAKFNYLDKAGVIGGIFSAFAAATPCCLPLLATAGASLGLGFLMPYQSVLEWVFQGFAFLALFAVIIAFRRHKQLIPLLLMLGLLPPFWVTIMCFVRPPWFMAAWQHFWPLRFLTIVQPNNAKPVNPAKQKPLFLNPLLLVRTAAQLKTRLCLPTVACSSMSVLAVTSCCARVKDIVACFAHTALCLARLSSNRSVAAPNRLAE